MATTISSNIGVGSGLPLADTLEKLRTVESAPLTLITNQKTQQTSRQSAYDAIKTAVTSFQTAAEALNKAGLFQATQTSVSGSAFTATSTSQAAVGSYTIAVESLAQAHSIYTSSSGISSRDTALGTGGEVTFTLADGSSQTLQLEGEVTLESLAKAINGDDKLGVSATLINDGSSVRLMLTSADTGTEAAIAAIGVTGNDTLQDLIGYDGTADSDASNFSTGSEASDARLSINGLSVISQSNTIADVVDGVTLTLAAGTAGKTEKLTVSSDTSAASTAIQSYVSAYNNLQKVIQQATAFDVDAETQAALAGDYTARSIATRMAQTLQVSGSGSTIQSLADLGISTDPTTGLLKTDSDKLSAALKDHSRDVASLFQAADTGIVAKATTVTKQMLASDGLFSTLSTSSAATLKRLDKQYEAASARIDATMAVYTAKFTALDALVAQMSSTSTYLTEQLAALNTNKKSS